MGIEGFLGDFYLWVKALHVISVIFWMAGLFLMPRYLAHHMDYPAGGSEDARWIEREAKLAKIILGPAMHAAWTFGILLILNIGFDAGIWFYVKLGAVIALTIFQVFVARWRKQAAVGIRHHDSRFFRMVNEIPAFVIIIAVIMVIVRPF